MRKIITTIVLTSALLFNQEADAQCASANTVSTANLVVHLPFTNGTGTDISGNNYNATFVGSSSANGVTGLPGKAVAFTGNSASGGSIPDYPLLTVTNQMTIAAWVNSESINSAQRIVDKLNGTTPGNFMLDLYQSKPRFFIGPSVILTTSYTLSSYTWYFIACTYDGTTAKLYVNNVLETSFPMTGNLTASGTNLLIGKSQATQNNFYGSIDDFKFYTRSLSASELTDLYQTPQFSVQPTNAGLCLSTISMSATAVSAGSSVTYKWKKGATYLTDNATFSGTASNTLTITNGTATELGAYEAEAYSAGCIATLSDTAFVVNSTTTTINNSDLILHYPFNNVSGADASGHNLNATIGSSVTSAVDQTGAYNKAITLGGSAPCSTPHNVLMNVTNQLTLACWFNSGSIGTAQRIIDKINGVTTGNFLVDLNAGHLRFFCGASSITTTATLLSNTWYHVTCTYDGVNLKVYLNGVLINTVAYVGTCTSNTSVFYIGRNQAGANLFIGKINDVRFYGRALPQADITALQTLNEFNTTQISNATTCVGGTAHFIATGAGSSVSYQWKKNGVAMTNGGGISGATSATLTISNTTLGDFASYLCEITLASYCAIITTNSVTLTQSTIGSISNSGLIMHYPFNGGTGQDLSGNSLNATLPNGVLPVSDQTGTANSAVTFNGLTTYTSTPHNALMNVTNQLTLACWFNSGSIGSSQRLMDKISGVTTGNFLVDLNASLLRFFCGANSITTSMSLSSNTWYHVACTYDGALMKVYLNGLLINSQVYTGTLTSNTSPFLVGSDQVNGNFFLGSINDVRFYNRALSQTEVTTLLTLAEVSIQSPANTNACLGNNVSLTTSITGAAASYQWKKNGVAMTNGGTISGVNTSTLTISGVVLSDFDTYSCDVFINSNCNVITTNAATITQSTGGATINSFPSSQTICAGSALTLTATVTGATAVQWQLNGTNIVGATANTYSVPSATGANAGNYTLVVTGTCGNITSTVATVTVNTPAAITSSPTSQSICSGSLVTFTGSASNSTALQWQLNGTNVGGATSASYTIPSVSGANAGSYTLVATGACGNVTTTAAVLTVVAPAVITTSPVSQSVCAGGTVTFTGAATGATSYQWQYNGTNIGGATSTSYTIPSVIAGNAGSYTLLATNTTCGSTTSTAAILTVPTGAAITLSPTSQTICSGSSVTFTASASNATSVQWQRNGTNIGGATSSTYTIPSVSVANAGSYTLVATGACGTVTTTAAVLTVNTPAVITTSPTSQSVCVGGTVTMTGAATNATAYQWQYNGTNISGATSASYTIASATVGNAGNYTLVATGACGNVTSQIGILTVNIPAAITSSPTSQTICEGASVTFTASASNSSSVQWQYNGTNISGATSGSYTIPSVISGDAGNYTMEAVGACGVVVSNQAVLTVAVTTAITTQPTATTTLCTTSAYSISVNAAGSNLTYVWFKDGVSVAGQTTANLSIPSAQLTDSAYYTVAVTGTCGMVISTVAALDVNDGAVVTSSPSSQSLCEGASITITATVTGATSVQWQLNGTDISGATSDSYNIPTATAADAGVYTLDATSTCGIVTSTPATLTVNLSTAFTVQPTATTVVCVGNSINLSVTAVGDNVTYQWMRNGTSLLGEVASTLTIPNAQTTDSAYYSVDAMGTCGAVLSMDANVDVQPLPTPTITQVGFTLTSDITGAAYQWYFNSTIMNGETAVSTIATANGNYSVEVTSVDGCSGVSPDLNVTSIGVNQLTIDNGQWTIYPNPATTQLQVSSSKFQVGEVMIYNVTGQLVLQTKVSNQQSTINISDLAKGIYTIKMMSNSDVNVLRFIKE